MPSPLQAEPHCSSPAAQLTPPAGPCSLPARPTWCPGTCRPSPGLLSCRRMARKKSWETMALLPSPSCSTLPPHSPSSLASWAHSLVLGCREKLIPPTSHQGRAPARQDPPLPGAHQGGARTTGKGTPLEWGWKVQLVRPQPSLLTSLLSDPRSPSPNPESPSYPPQRSPQCNSQAQP